MSSLRPTSVSFYPSDRETLAYCTRTTGLTATVLLRRLLYRYAAGVPIPGLPVITPYPKAMRVCAGLDATEPIEQGANHGEGQEAGQEAG